MKLIKSIWQKWQVVAKPIGNFQSQALLSVFYILIILPLGIFYRFFKDDLNTKNANKRGLKTNFEDWHYKKETLEEAKNQY